MPLIIKILIPVLITAVMGTGGVIIWKITSQPVIPDLTATATLKVNAINNSITVPFETPITLSWESKNVDNCLISGDWYSPVSTSGSQSVGKITKPANYTLDCFDSDGKKISSSVAVNIDNKTIPQEFLSSISLTDLFKDFRYFWKKELCSGLKNDPDVVALQTALFFEGLLSPQEKITGNYDDNTFQAVKKFQENYGITPPTGCVKSQTIAKLNDLFYYYNYSDQLAFQELSQKQITATTQKITSYQSVPAATSTIYSILDQLIPTIIPTPTTTQTAIIAAAKPSLDLKVNNSSRSAVNIIKGGTATLTWTSKNVKSCTASGNWTGPKQTSNSTGEKTDPINKSSTFKLTCIGENNQNVAKSVYVSIPAAPIVATPKDIRPVIIKVIKVNCALPVVSGGLVEDYGCQIKIEGKNFDRHSNAIIVDCANEYCFKANDDSIRGGNFGASNGSIDIDSDEPDTATSTDSRKTEPITFSVVIEVRPGFLYLSKISIKVHTPSGGTSDGVDTNLKH